MAGRIGLATAGSILPAGWGGLAAGPAVGASGDAAEVEAQERRMDALAAGDVLTGGGVALAEEVSLELEAGAGAGAGVEVEVGAGVEAEVEEEEEEEETSAQLWEDGLGRGVRQGLLRVPMPTRLRHSMCVCHREGDKGAVVEALLREQQAVRRRRGEAGGAGPLLPGALGASEGEGGVSDAARALLLVRDGLALAEVVEELEVSSRGGTTPLHPSAPRLCKLPSPTLARARLPSLPPAR